MKILRDSELKVRTVRKYVLNHSSLTYDYHRSHAGHFDEVFLPWGLRVSVVEQMVKSSLHPYTY